MNIATMITILLLGFGEEHCRSFCHTINEPGGVVRTYCKIYCDGPDGKQRECYQECVTYPKDPTPHCTMTCY
jgi:hypothetical protein